MSFRDQNHYCRKHFGLLATLLPRDIERAAATPSRGHRSAVSVFRQGYSVGRASGRKNGFYYSPRTGPMALVTADALLHGPILTECHCRHAEIPSPAPDDPAAASA